MDKVIAKHLNRIISGIKVGQISDCEAVIGTSVGLKRTENQDRVVISKVHGDKNLIYCFILCDGMGGMVEGGTAASYTVANILSKLSEIDVENENFTDLIKKIIIETNTGLSKQTGGKSGTTLTMLLVKKSGAYLVSIGDSRAYTFALDKPHLLTEDDNIINELKEISNIKVNESLVKKNGLTQFIGMEDDPEFEVDILSNKEEYLLSSDGFHLIGDNNLSLFKKYANTPVEYIQRCIHYSNWIGGVDNSSAIYIEPKKLPFTSHEKGLIELWDPSGYFRFKALKVETEEKPIPVKRYIKNDVSKKLLKENKSVSESDNEGLEISTEASPTVGGSKSKS
ncbi:PP2C family serine/threonine-protein phosphatase [Pseudoalteromonas sp. SG45-2]|uniref:PP2C family protein-serine/threonine phosphatase n=1 Tax=Pseudoalteromonas sp. SG45-2 TaxID=2760956 RepID=UPI0015FF2980|nr:PP2C family serine/threonine-protein phosphatase [Pseudoalteromonas sp. SG45-2]MBB1345722.1 serine/threonine-protein phosphatase [Pseudoalteromonas sp. SG45-2]